jgi:hypothetical protein
MISCSRLNPLSRDELLSDLQAAVSLASETELFTAVAGGAGDTSVH